MKKTRTKVSNKGVVRGKLKPRAERRKAERENSYEAMLKKLNMTQEDMDDLTRKGQVIEYETNMYYTGPSEVHGEGVFAVRDVLQHEIIGLGTLDNIHQTLLNRYINHSSQPNANFYMLRNSDLVLIALENIQADEEIFCDYSHHLRPTTQTDETLQG
jgi:hypothetical protein